MFDLWDLKLRPAMLSFVIGIIIALMAIPYGNEEKKIDFTYEINSADTVFEAGDGLSFEVTATNCDRPFEIDSNDTMSVKFYQIIDGERVSLGGYVWRNDIGTYPNPKLFKKGDTFTYTEYIELTVFDESDVYIPGTYDAEVEFYGCKQVFEDVITVK